MNEVICDYCGKPAELVDGSVIYPHRPDLSHKTFWLCRECEAYVGCHKNSGNKPLGRLANMELRQAKMRAHAAFDPFWKSGRIKRADAYRRLAKKLGIPTRECHIGMFDVEMCEEVVRVCRGKS